MIGFVPPITRRCLSVGPPRARPQTQWNSLSFLACWRALRAAALLSPPPSLARVHSAVGFRGRARTSAAATRCRRCRRETECAAWPSLSPILGTVSTRRFRRRQLLRSLFNFWKGVGQERRPVKWSRPSDQGSSQCTEGKTRQPGAVEGCSRLLSVRPGPYLQSPVNSGRDKRQPGEEAQS